MGQKITRAMISTRIAQGFGQGHGAHYKEWLGLGRGKFIPKSLHGWYINLETGKQDEVFSDIERAVGLCGRWLGAVDVRFQFPIWTFPHPSRLEDWPGRDPITLPWSMGSVKLAAEHDMEHPRYVGTDIDFIQTLDVAFTVPPRRQPGLVGTAAKPSGKVRVPEPDFRVADLLRLQEIYMQSIGGEFRLVDETFCPPELLKNLAAAYASSVLPDALQRASLYERFLDFVRTAIAEVPTNLLLQAFARRTNISVPDATTLIDHAAWRQDIPIDLSRPCIRTEPCVLWSGEVVRAMRQELFGCPQFERDDAA